MTLHVSQRALRGAPLALALLSLVLLSACQSALCLFDPDEEGICESRQDISDRYIELDGPITWNKGVAYRSDETNRITLLETDRDAVTIDHINIPSGSTLMRATPNKDRLLVLAPGSRTLSLITPRSGEREDYALGSPFDSLSVSEDGRFAIAYFAPKSESDLVIRNNNEMAVIDLSASPSTANPQIIALRSFGSRPTGVQFAPSFTIQGEERRMALILSDNYITLLELDGFDPENPNNNEIVVPLGRSGTDEPLRANQIIWTDDDPNVDDDFFAFVLATGSDDIISLNLLPGETTDTLGRPKIRPSLNQLTGGRGPVSIALFNNKDGKRKLLSLNRTSRDLAVIDVSTSDTTLVELEDSVKDMMVYQALNKKTGKEEPFALLFDASGNTRTLLFVELETVEVRRTRALDHRVLDRGVIGLTMTPDNEGVPRALLLHADLDSFSILNLEQRFVTPLDVSSQIGSFSFDSQDSVLVSLDDANWITSIELSNGHPTSVRLDQEVTVVAAIPETRSVVVDHGHPLGSVTILSQDQFNRESAQTIVGFGANDLLDVEDK